MKKRFVAFLLVLIMVLGMLPVSAFAGDGTTTPTTDTFIVTYTDGVGGAVFDDKTRTVAAGEATPEFGKDPFRSGYTFRGWQPKVAQTVTGDATYTAKWTPVGPTDDELLQTVEFTCSDGETISPATGVKVLNGGAQTGTTYRADVDRSLLEKVLKKAGLSDHTLGDYTRSVTYSWNADERTWKTSDTVQVKLTHPSTEIDPDVIPKPNLKENVSLDGLKLRIECEDDTSHAVTVLYSAGTLKPAWDSKNNSYSLYFDAASYLANSDLSVSHDLSTTEKNSQLARSFSYNKTTGKWEQNAKNGPTIYVKCKTKTLFYDANAGTDNSKVKNMPENVTVKAYGFYSFPVNNETFPTRPGYKFLGWNTAPYKDSDWAHYKVEDLKTGKELTISTGADMITLYAIWEKDAPDAPTADELKKLEMAVQVKCDVDKLQQHKDAYGLLGKYDEDYLVGEPKKVGDDWLCDINYVPDLYVAKFNKAFPNLKHVQNDEKIVPVTLILDGGSWRIMTQGLVHVTEEYTVTFNAYGGSPTPDEQHVKSGEKAVPPADPTLKGFTFAFWYLGENEQTATAYNFNTPVTENITLTAKWEINKFKVTFDSNGGSKVDPQVVEYGLYAKKPADPTLKGFTFACWYLGENEQTATAYDFNTPVTENITLTAKWEINKYTVTFDPNGGTPVPPKQEVEYGLTATKPDDPTRTGYTFDGWYLGDEKYDFSAAVEQNITLTAKWRPATVYLFVRPVDSTGKNLLTGANALLDSTLEKAGFTGGYNASDKQYITVGKMTTKHVLPTYPAATVITDGKLLLDVVNELGDYYSTYDKHEDALGFNAKDQDGLDWYKLEYMPATSTHYGYEGQSEAYHLNGLLKFYYTAYENGLPDGSTETVGNMPVNNYPAKQIYDYYIFNNRFTLPDKIPTREGYTFLGWKAQEINNGGAVAYANRGSQLYQPGQTYGDEYSGIRNDVVFTAQWEKNLNVEITDISYDTWPRFLGDTFTVTAKADDADAVVTLDYDLDGAHPFELTDTTKNNDGSYTFTFKVVQITAANYNPRSNGEFFTATATKDNVTATDTDAKEINLRNRVHLKLLESGGTTGDETPVNNATVVIENIYVPGATQPMPYDAAKQEYRTKDWDISNGDDGKIIISVNGQTIELTKDVNGRDIRTVLKEGKEEVYATYTIPAYSFVGALMVNGTKASYYSGDRAFGKYGEAVNIEKLVTDAIARVKSDAVDGLNNPSKVEIKITRPGKATANGEITAAQFGVGVTNNKDNDLTQPWLRPDYNLFRSEVWYNATTYYNVSFDTDGGSEVDNLTDVKYNTTITLPTTTKEGYTFAGWFYLDGTEFTATSTITKKTDLKAKWTPNKYTVTFDANGGTGTMADQEFTYDVEQALNENKFSRTGYTFKEWTTNADGTGDKYADKATVKNLATEGSVTLYAQWTANKYTVTFDANGGTGTMADQEFTYDVEQALNENKFSRTGYTFKEWTTNADGTGDKYADKATVKNLATEGSVTLYAQWTANKYTVTFNANGGTDAEPASKPVTYDSAYGPLATTSRKGYTLVGWFTAKDGGTKVESTTVVATAGDHTLYAHWTPNTYNYEIHYYVQQPDGNYVEDASALDTTKSGTFDSTVTVTPDANKYGAHFSVNNTKSKLSGVVTVNTPAEILKLEVYYDRDFHTLTYLDSRNGSVIGTTTVRCGVSVAAPKDPTKAGYWFDGWYNAADNKKVTFPVTLTNNMTVYAGWTMIVLPSTIAKKTPKLNTADHFAYVQGYPDGTVKPAGNITRAETAAILFRLMDDTSRNNYYSTKSGFRDVAAGTWYNTYVATLNNAGVITDSANGYFRPNEAITRAELAAMLASFTETTRAANYFDDVSANHWAANAIAICAKLGWITGYPDGSFRPDRNVTRAELMAMINRATGRAPKSADAFLPGMKTWSDNTADKWYYLDVQEATNSHSYTVRPTEIWTAITAAPNWSKYE